MFTQKTLQCELRWFVNWTLLCGIFLTLCPLDKMGPIHCSYKESCYIYPEKNNNYAILGYKPVGLILEVPHFSCTDCLQFLVLDSALRRLHTIT